MTAWADGYGIWHARVPRGPYSEDIARDMIRDELEGRSAISPSYRLLVEHVPEHDTTDTEVYREVV